MLVKVAQIKFYMAVPTLCLTLLIKQTVFFVSIPLSILYVNVIIANPRVSMMLGENILLMFPIVSV